MYLCTIILILRNVSGRPQIVVYRAPSTHISLVVREKCFLPKSLISLISHRSLDLVVISHLSNNNPTTQQQVNNNTTQQSTTKRHDNNNHTTTTTETTQQPQQDNKTT